MIYFNGDIKKIHYNGYDITSVYACGGNLVWSGDTPTPPTPTGGTKYQAIYSDLTTYSVNCNTSTTLTSMETRESSKYTATTEVTIGECVTSIGDNAFESMRQLKRVNSDTDGFCVIPSGITLISTAAFSNCAKFTNIIIPDNVTFIGENAFVSCARLETINIPSGVTELKGGTFMGCISLTSIEIPSGVTSISFGVFQGCISLTSIEIPSGVTYIGDNAFKNCSGLTEIIINAAMPPTLRTTVFENTNNCPIYVPDGSVTAYQSASGWSDYADRIKGISEKP